MNKASILRREDLDNVQPSYSRGYIANNVISWEFSLNESKLHLIPTLHTKLLSSRSSKILIRRRSRL